jgi:spore maturation protein A
MLNYIWFAIILLSVAAGAISGKIDAVTEAAIASAETAVELSIGLIGIMALWLGMMKIAEASGLVNLIAQVVKPITLRLFPDVPPDHPAIGSIVLNMSANILGLGNAATPLGLKAMQELQEINPDKDTATDAMCMFLAINTSSVQLILPATVVGLMGTASSQVFLSTILATSLSTMTGITAAKLLAKTKRFALPTPPQEIDEI